MYELFRISPELSAAVSGIHLSILAVVVVEKTFTYWSKMA
jgi:hypothetical protein